MLALHRHLSTALRLLSAATLSAAISSALPAAVDAQGRLITRPCTPPPPPRCPPDSRCAVPFPAPCGPTLVRLTSDARIALADRVLRYEVTEVFKNTGRAVAEADYIFPLPPGAAFEDLKLSINGELVSGETLPADKARGIYEEIVRRQRDPALVEWMGSGMLRTRIFPINPGEEKKIVVRYQSVAEREGDALRIDYRRGTDPNGTGAQGHAGQGGVAAQPARDARDARGRSDDEGGEWSHVRFLYQPGSNYGEPYSPTHTLRTRDEGRYRQVDARGSAPEVTILLPLRRANAAALSVLAHAPSRTERGFALITVTPPAATGRAVPRDLTFVVDVSGSMAGRKLDQAKAAGRALLESLRPDDRFRIIDFSTDVRAFRNGFTSATPANLNDARRYMDALRAEGGTNIAGALEEALDTDGGADGWADGDPEAVRRTSRGMHDRLPLVVFITDGEPTVGERNADRIAEMAARLRGEARVFSVGVSADVNATLVEQLAVEGHGTAHFVRDSESVERTASLLARRLSTPVLTNLRLRAEGVQLSHVLPTGALDVFAGQDLVILARYEGDGMATLRLEGESPDGPVTWTTRANFPSRTRDNPFVARLWAAQRVGWLAAEKRKRGGTLEIDAEIRSLGERYGIPTEFSSYLVLEPGMAGGNVRPAPSPALRRSDSETRFEAAKAAAAQREAKSVAELDADLVPAAAGTQKRIANRPFTLVNGVWTDARYTQSMRTVTVKPFSPAYFALVQRFDELAAPFALGDRVIVAGRTVAVALAADGAERLDAATMDSLARDW